MAALDVAPLRFSAISSGDHQQSDAGHRRARAGGMPARAGPRAAIHLSGSHGSHKAMPSDIPALFKPFNMWDLVTEAEELMRERESN